MCTNSKMDIKSNNNQNNSEEINNKFDLDLEATQIAEFIRKKRSSNNVIFIKLEELINRYIEYHILPYIKIPHYKMVIKRYISKDKIKNECTTYFNSDTIIESVIRIILKYMQTISLHTPIIVVDEKGVEMLMYIGYEGYNIVYKYQKQNIKDENNKFDLGSKAQTIVNEMEPVNNTYSPDDRDSLFYKKIEELTKLYIEYNIVPYTTISSVNEDLLKYCIYLYEKEGGQIRYNLSSNKYSIIGYIREILRYYVLTILKIRHFEIKNREKIIELLEFIGIDIPLL